MRVPLLYIESTESIIQICRHRNRQFTMYKNGFKKTRNISFHLCVTR